MEQQRTELSALGEFTLIKHLTQYFLPKNEGTIRDAGDDAAGMQPMEGKQLVMKNCKRLAHKKRPSVILIL